VSFLVPLALQQMQALHFIVLELLSALCAILFAYVNHFEFRIASPD
jgi:hypothetical protein